MTTTITQLTSETLGQAYEGSWYIICGTGDPLEEWINGYEEALAKAGISKPTAWYSTTGEHINAYAGEDASDLFQPNTACLLFPLEGLEVGKLAMFKLQWCDRWFDDVINNMRYHVQYLP